MRHGPSRRADNQRNLEALKVLRGRAKHAEAALEPLRARVRELTARAESHAEEVKAVRRYTRRKTVAGTASCSALPGFTSGASVAELHTCRYFLCRMCCMLRVYVFFCGRKAAEC